MILERDMKEMIDAIIPTYKRSDKLANLIKSFKTNSSQARLLFVINLKDEDSRNILEKLGTEFITCNGEYVECINSAVQETDNPFIFCGADDILFTKNWDKKLLKVMEDEKVMVTGGIDDWTISKSGVHVSHPLVRRSYLGQSYWNATTNDLYCPEYIHYQCDIELEQLAHTRGALKVCDTCEIPHHHYVNGKSQDDYTYTRSRNNNIIKDTKTYNERRHNFEYYDVEGMNMGIAQPSAYQRKRLTIVMPIWNCKRYVKQTVESLIANTLNKHELILIDDHSTEFDGNELLPYLATKCLKNGFSDVKWVVNKQQRYCNYNWNKGMELATGDYIAIINSDIEFKRENWDEYLIKHIDEGVELANPYESNHVIPKPYGMPPINSFLENYNIRGCCFMMSKELMKRIFPIPKTLVHWFGDNWIARGAKSYVYERKVNVYHYISKSGEKVDQLKFWNMVYQDCFEYEKLTGEPVEPIKEKCLNQINNVKRELGME